MDAGMGYGCLFDSWVIKKEEVAVEAVHSTIKRVRAKIYSTVFSRHPMLLRSILRALLRTLNIPGSRGIFLYGSILAYLNVLLLLFAQSAQSSRTTTETAGPRKKQQAGHTRNVCDFYRLV